MTLFVGWVKSKIIVYFYQRICIGYTVIYVNITIFLASIFRKYSGLLCSTQKYKNSQCWQLCTVLWLFQYEFHLRTIPTWMCISTVILRSPSKMWRLPNHPLWIKTRANGTMYTIFCLSFCFAFLFLIYPKSFGYIGISLSVRL